MASSAARWLPKELVESSFTGGVFTVLAYILMLVVFVNEVWSFFAGPYSTTLGLDKSGENSLQINFDVDFLDIECRNLKVVVYAQAEKERMSAWAQEFWLRPVDRRGRPYGMGTRPWDLQKDEEKANREKVDEAAHAKRMEELLKVDGQKELDSDWASSNDGFKHQSFEHVIEAHDFTVINFFAEWCSHCQQFSPAWAQMAEQVNSGAIKFADKEGREQRVRMIKMNCVDFRQLCMDKGIDAYPMIRIYKADGTFSIFTARRDQDQIMRWMERTIKGDNGPGAAFAGHHEVFEQGCNTRGRIQVPRVPGHLEFMVGGGDQNLNPRLTNVSHFVRHLSFSDPDDGKNHRQNWFSLPSAVSRNLAPLDGRKYLTTEFHQAHIHDMQVVSTVSPSGRIVYQFRHYGRISKVPEEEVPQAKFHYDIEPFSVQVNYEDKRWYDFATSLMAVLGGSFVVMKLLACVSLAAAGHLRHLLKRTGSNSTGHINIGHLQ